MHTLRANYQAAIHRRSLARSIGAPSPVGHGWEIVDGKLVIKWMTINPAPDILLKVTQCACKVSKCSSSRCSCKKAKVPCSDLCKCSDCDNVSHATDLRDDCDDGDIIYCNDDQEDCDEDEGYEMLT